MTGLDETSAEIGALKARADAGERSDKLILEKLDEIIDRLSAHDARVQANHDTLTNDVLPEIRVWRSMRQRALGGAAVVMCLLSLAASIFTDWATSAIRKIAGMS